MDATTEPIHIKHRDLPSRLNYLAEQLTRAHDDLEPVGEGFRAPRTTILAVAIALGQIADSQPDRPRGACPATKTTPIMPGYETLSSCIYDFEHTGAHRGKDGVTW